MVRDIIEEALQEFYRENEVQPTVIYLDAYYLSSLAEELNYTEDEVFFENALEYYAGCELKVLEDDGPEIIRVE
jgi:hypothetical protein